MPESPGLYLRLTVAENLECFAGLYELSNGKERIEAALAPLISLTEHVTPAKPCPRASNSASVWLGHC